MKTEAAVIIGAVEAAVMAGLGLAAYVLGWEEELAVLVVGVAAAVVALIGAVATRGQVYSQTTVDQLAAAKQKPKPKT